MPGPERETSRKRTPTPRTDTMHVEERGAVTNVTFTKENGSVTFSRHRDGSLGIVISGDFGVSERIVLANTESLKTALKSLRPRKTTKR